jgi:holo-[acyl-carrier protein] synthase
MVVGLGVDVVDLERVREALSRSGERFVRRVYTEAEAAYCGRHRDPVPHFAARFAAKEALFKALGTGWSQGVRWRDVEVERVRGRAPRLVLHGEALRHSQRLGTQTVHCTLSHSAASAVAVVILEN